VVATMVFLTPDPTGVPFLANHAWIRNRAREERIVLLWLARAVTPYVSVEHRVTIETLSPRLRRVTARFGYMEAPRLRPILHACAAHGLDIDRDDTSFFYADAQLERRPHGGLPTWQRSLFVALKRNSRPLPDDLKIPAERRVELGVTVAI
jgi:KUP system potassium uptake protein